MSAPAIHRIVLTGGPCAGKSTALVRLHRHLEGHNVKVYLVPEAATLLLGGGIVVKDAPLAHMVSFQRSIIRIQMALEEAFTSFARVAARAAVLLCDRGVLDGGAYLPPQAWQELLTSEGIDEALLRESRYDAVVHLVTAAHGVEDCYGTHTNAVRYEDAAGAREVCDRLRRTWLGHPRLCVIDTHPDFEVKMHRVLCAVSDVVGVPLPPAP
jgi:predicted ATPase